MGDGIMGHYDWLGVRGPGTGIGARKWIPVLCAVVVMVVGCEPSAQLESSPERAEQNTVKAEDDAKAPAMAESDESQSSDNTSPQTGEATVVGIDDFQKGKRLRESKYQTSRALSVRFTIEQKYIIANKDRALQLYQAEHGEFPKSHEEFMEKIIRPNNIQLPALEPGYEYLYKPEDPMNLYKIPVSDDGP